MSDSKDALVGVRFHRGSPPYEAGDVAGFPRAHAQRLVDSGRATFLDAVDAPVVDLSDMNRDQLMAYAREHLGFADEPPAEVTDDQLRDAIREQIAANAPLGDQGTAPATPTADATKPAKAGKGS